MRNFLTSLLPGRAADALGAQTTKRINLALQGGGAHGAFTWGVLEHLLSDERLFVEGISGTSAGAVNAVMLADGLARGGRAEAAKRLADFWRAASSNGNLPTLQRAVMERLLSFTPLEGSPVQAWLDALFLAVRRQPAQHQSAQGSDRALRGLRGVARVHPSPNLHLGDQRADRPCARLFAREDHGRCGNGVSLPAASVPRRRDRRRALLGRRLSRQSGDLSFFRTTNAEDVLVVQINPLVRQKTPTSSSEIMNRINEITFNSSLISEYRAIEFVARLIDHGRLPRGTGPGQYRRINVHRIVLDRFGTHFDAFGKLSTDYEFFEMLRLSGKRAARRFLDEHFNDIGVRSTVDLRAEAQAEWP